eukprot:9150328-Alexandrium_andersonii.AAC.1
MPRPPRSSGGLVSISGRAYGLGLCAVWRPCREVRAWPPAAAFRKRAMRVALLDMWWPQGAWRPMAEKPTFRPRLSATSGVRVATPGP